MHLLRLFPSLLKPPYPISILEDKFQVPLLSGMLVGVYQLAICEEQGGWEA